VQPVAANIACFSGQKSDAVARFATAPYAHRLRIDLLDYYKDCT
jgi:hypothetical protein